MVSTGEQDFPRDAEAARRRLEEGNRRFVGLAQPRVEPPARVTGVVPATAQAAPGTEPIPLQRPFAAVLGCSDARIPVELLFSSGVNELFVTRVAGQVPGNEVLGSIQYAALHLESLRLVVVLGHTACGAVSAAVDAHLDTLGSDVASPVPGPASGKDDVPAAMQGLVEQIVPAVEIAATGLVQTHGKEALGQAGSRAALLTTAVGINAAFTAQRLGQELAAISATPPPVVFGVFDLAQRRVGLPTAAEQAIEVALLDPPADLAGLHRLAIDLASSPGTRRAPQFHR